MAKKKFFSGFGVKYFDISFPEYSKKLKKTILKSNLELVYDVYLGKIIFLSALIFIALLAAMISLILFFTFDIFITILLLVVVPLFSGIVAFLIGFYYPSIILRQGSGNIESNMPFAINHMAAVVSSGAKPSAMFEFLSNNKEYGLISKEAGYIFRNIKLLGMDMTTAIREVAERTPNKKFSEFLFGLINEIKGGGDLKDYINKTAENALFDYRIRREKYLTLLSNYADIYIAVLIVAPLFFIAILSVMSMVGGQIGDFGIGSLMEIGVYAVLPLLNIIFLIFVHATQPEM